MTLDVRGRPSVCVTEKPPGLHQYMYHIIRSTQGIQGKPRKIPVEVALHARFDKWADLPELR